MTTMTEASVKSLIEAIDIAVETDDGDLLERAWYDLYNVDKAKAVHVAMILKPMARRSSLRSPGDEVVASTSSMRQT
jgi:hypothetical protein